MEQNKRITWLDIAILIVNLLGIGCLIWFGGLYLSHSTHIAYPEAMLPMPDWERGGTALVIGTLPMLAANAMAFLFPGRKLLPGKTRLLCFLPALICAGLAVSDLIVSLI